MARRLRIKRTARGDDRDPARTPTGTKADRSATVAPLPVRVRYAIALLVAAIALYGAGLAYHTSMNVSHDEHITCLIQKHGIVANKVLKQVVVSVALAIPHDSQIDKLLFRYVSMENALPTRKC